MTATGMRTAKPSTARMPVVFVSHGAPDALIKAPATVCCWQRLGESLPRPTAIVVASAHWEAALPTVSLAAHPETIHDFSGFDRALYDLRYPAPGAPDFGQRILELLTETGMAAARHPTRGLDHGAWVPLRAMFPQADIPVTQLALPHAATPAELLALGRALAPLRDEGVLILGSGAITHNFGWLNWRVAEGDAPMPQARAFADWIGDRAMAGDVTALVNFRQTPEGNAAHPSDEHFAPFLIALGAADGDVPQRHQPPFTYGALAMDTYLWNAPPTA